MMRNLLSTGLVIAAAALAGAASAQSMGAEEFMNSCASCHGPDGKGEGPLVGYLMGSIPDLTQLQKDNGGVFPVTRVYSTIDGTMTSGAHGTREMPVWGNRYFIQGKEAANPDFALREADTFVKFRILALTEYIASIQEE